MRLAPAWTAARAAVGRARGRERAAPASDSDPALEPDATDLRKQLRRNEQQLSRLQERLAALEEQLSESRRIGLQVAHLGDLVTELLARRAAGDEGDFSTNASRYADDI